MNIKSRIKEKGSAVEVVIIIVLVLAVLGLLGFVYWQNFINKPTANTQSLTQQVAKDTQSLTVSEWGVKGDYSGTHTISYELDQFGSLTMNYSGLGSDCGLGYVSKGAGGDDAVVGSTFSGKTTKEAYDLGYGDARAQVEGNYYLYTGPQTACEDASGQSQAVAAVKEFVTSLRAE